MYFVRTEVVSRVAGLKTSVFNHTPHYHCPISLVWLVLWRVCFFEVLNKTTLLTLYHFFLIFCQQFNFISWFGGIITWSHEWHPSISIPYVVIYTFIISSLEQVCAGKPKQMAKARSMSNSKGYNDHQKEPVNEDGYQMCRTAAVGLVTSPISTSNTLSMATTKGNGNIM